MSPLSSPAWVKPFWNLLCFTPPEHCYCITFISLLARKQCNERILETTVRYRAGSEIKMGRRNVHMKCANRKDSPLSWPSLGGLFSSDWSGEIKQSFTGQGPESTSRWKRVSPLQVSFCMKHEGGGYPLGVSISAFLSQWALKSKGFCVAGQLWLQLRIGACQRQLLLE